MAGIRYIQDQMQTLIAENKRLRLEVEGLAVEIALLKEAQLASRQGN